MSLWTLTCANEEDVIVSISGSYTVHSNLSESVTCTHLHEDRAPPDGQDRVVHERVVPGKLDDVVREILGGTEGAEGLAGTLKRAWRKASSDIDKSDVQCPLGTWNEERNSAVLEIQPCPGEAQTEPQAKERNKT